jgi:small-conductance mechanosensitive channel
MNELRTGATDLLHTFKPDSLVGAIVYLALFVIAAMLLSRGMRSGMHAVMSRGGHLDRTTISFLQQITSALIWVVMLSLYAHLVPELRALGTALLAGASIASIVIGLAAQSTLGNLVAGIAITIYRPFRLGDTLQVAAPTGTEVGVVETITLGYTTLRTADGRHVVLPNSLAASQTLILRN